MRIIIRAARGEQLAKHVLIAGSGRAGSSCLVEVLSACGLQTHLDRPNRYYNERARAGLEDHLLGPDAPYVCKSPWSYLLIEKILNNPNIQLDHVFIPFRDVEKAAISRIIVEKQALRSACFTLGDSFPNECGYTPGGAITSLEVVDQMRIISLSLMRLLDPLIERDIDFSFVAFPRFTSDPIYLFKKLRPILPDGMTSEDFLSKTMSVLKPQHVRVETEITQSLDPLVEGAVLRRENAELRARLAEQEALQYPFFRKLLSRIRKPETTVTQSVRQRA